MRGARAIRQRLPVGIARNASAALLGLALLAGGVASLLAGGLPMPPATPAARGCILISIDTLRADHLGCYGYRFPTTPQLDRFRRDAVLFATAIAQAPSTLASHASMLTSLLLPQHGASYKRGTALASGVETLAQVLLAHGFRTLSFNEGGQIGPEFGLGRGFERYRSAKVGPGTARLANQVAPAILWLQRHPGAPFFLFLHTYQVHHPYTPDRQHLAMIEGASYHGRLPADQTPLEVLAGINEGFLRLDAADLRHVVATYDAQIRAMDDDFGGLVAFLRQHGLYDSTAIVFTSDHGEEFGEHGQVGWHSHTLYDELLRVPLLIKYPGGAHGGETVPEQVRGIDVAPTVLAVLGVPSPGGFAGLDLTPLALRRPEPERLAVSNLDGGGVAAIRSRRWKLIRSHLFDLARDPGETRDVSAGHADVAAYLEQRREAQLAAAPNRLGPAAAFGDEATAALAALGYVAAGVPARGPKR